MPQFERIQFNHEVIQSISIRETSNSFLNQDGHIHMNLSYEAIKWTISYEPIVWTYSYEPVQTRFLKAVLEFDHDKLIMSNWGASEASLVSPNCPWMTSMENLPWLMGKFPLVSLWQSGKLYGQFSMACLMVHNLWASVQRWSPNLMSKWCQTLDFNMTLVNVTLVNMISTNSLSLCSPLDQ